MKMRSKLIATIVSMCAAVAVMAVGVWAATSSFSVTISNTINIAAYNTHGAVNVWTVGAENNVAKKAAYFNSELKGQTVETVVYDANGYVQSTIRALNEGADASTQPGLGDFAVNPSGDVVDGSQIVVWVEYVQTAGEFMNDTEFRVTDNTAAYSDHITAAYYFTLSDSAEIAAMTPITAGTGYGVNTADGTALVSNGTFYVVAVLTYSNASNVSVNESVTWSFTVDYNYQSIGTGSVATYDTYTGTGAETLVTA